MTPSDIRVDFKGLFIDETRIRHDMVAMGLAMAFLPELVNVVFYIFELLGRPGTSRSASRVPLIQQYGYHGWNGGFISIQGLPLQMSNGLLGEGSSPMINHWQAGKPIGSTEKMIHSVIN